MNITILGTGYLGLTTAAVFSQAGHTVYAVEPNAERLGAIKEGRSFFYEEGLDPLVAAGLENGTLIPTDSYEESVPHSDVVFSCVGTPDNPDGSANLKYVYMAAEEAAKYLRPDAVFVQKSTVPVGTGRKIMQLFADKNVSASYVSNPEFLSESTSVSDTMFYDRLIFAGENSEAIQKVRDVFVQVDEHAAEIAQKAGIPQQEKPNRHIVTSLESAELIKVTANSILALKISFANSIAKLADKAGADVNEVMDGVGADHRVGRAFLNAGRGYGGGCFPKDVSGLIASGLEHGVDLEIMQAAQGINETMPGYVVEKLQEALSGSVEGKKIAVLGLAFKANTSDTRRSPGITIANILYQRGAEVTAYDPHAIEEARTDLRNEVTLANSIDTAIEEVDAVIIATNWKQFLDYPPEDYASHMRGKLFFDAMNTFDKPAISQASLHYIGVGRTL